MHYKALKEILGEEYIYTVDFKTNRWKFKENL